MKKKLIGIAVASFGMILSIGGAIALYTTAADPASFGISQGTYEGSEGAITYKINGNTSGAVTPQYLKTDGTNGGTGLGGEYTQVKYEFALSATYSSSLIEQNFVVGCLHLTIDNIPAEYQGKLSIWAGIEGYEAGSLGEHYYAASLMPGEGDFAITSEASVFNVNSDIAVSTAGTQKLCVYLKYNLAGINVGEQNEASLGYSLDVSWGEPSSFNYAFVKGDNIMWAADEKYAMNPNINKPFDQGWEWVYNNLPGSFGPGAKCQVGDVWSADPNANLDAEKSYNVYWSGSAEAAANFQEIVVEP